MYWIFLVLFIITVLIPDIIREDVFFLTETRAEEAAIFLMGAIAFLVIIRNELLLTFHRKEKEKDEKKIKQTVKDLVESYSYIGEVNRKMDILMNIALGLSDRSLLSKKKEKDIYESIISAANFLLKSDCTCLKFINIKTARIEKELVSEGKNEPVGSNILADMDEEIGIKKDADKLIIASPQTINDIRSFLIISGYGEDEEKNPKNMEILKVFASQAIFLYSYINLQKTMDSDKK